MKILNNFMESTHGLTKNPLGIVGLFISMIYGFACLVLSTSISNLHSELERMSLILFIILFPIVILSAFLYLVVYHHEKLYAPSDFRDDSSFIETMSGRKINEKQEKEVEMLNSAEEETVHSDSEIFEKQTNQTKSTVKSEPTTKLDKSEIAIRLSNAEKWAIKELELQYNFPFKTNQQLVSNNMRLELDAYGTNSIKYVVAEVKYWESKKSIKPLLLSIQEFVSKRIVFKRAFGFKPVELVVVVVFDQIEEKNVTRLKEFMTKLHKDAHLKVMEYSQLEEDYLE